MADPPAPPKMFSISCSFSENLVKSYVGAPGGLAAPPTGNPESAPGGRGTLKEKRQCEILITSLCVEIPSLKENQFHRGQYFVPPTFVALAGCPLPAKLFLASISHLMN